MRQFSDSSNNSTNDEPVSFVDWLANNGTLTDAAAERATRGAAQTGERLVPLLSKLGILSETVIVKELSSFYKIPSISRADFPLQPLFVDRINKAFLQVHHILPVTEEGGELVLAMADPSDEAALSAIRFFSNLPIARRVASLTDIETAIGELYGQPQAAAVVTAPHVSEEQDRADIDQLVDLASDAPVIRLVHSLIGDAVHQGASDIHIEPFIDRLRVRFRIDGVLRNQESQPRQLGSAIISRIKIMARLNIAERRMPQDGSIRFTVLGKEIDIRVSSSPTVHGESIVLRILDRDKIALDFHALGFDDDILQPVLRLLHRPNGILLVTGPTGSGKTTTLYTALKVLNTPDKKILTIEDPIEYKLDGINQQEVLPQIHRTFSSALRSFLRQDPDILMVGEIRDSETAETAVQAALTGHLVLSTLHTNSAAGAMTRLIDMGVEDYLLASTVAGVLGQRLLRKLCMTCREPYTPMPDLVDRIFGGELQKPSTLYRAKGCPACHGSGYHGRSMVVELLTVTDDIRHLILKKTEAQGIQQAAVTRGMRTMYRHGLTKVMAGETSLEEVLRITQEV